MLTSKKLCYEEDIDTVLADIKEKNISIRKDAFKYGISFTNRSQEQQ